jgi:hypothetical protein
MFGLFRRRSSTNRSPSRTPRLRLEILEQRDVPTTVGWSVGAPPATMTWTSSSSRSLDQVTAFYSTTSATVQDDVTTSLTFIAPTTGNYRINTAVSPLSNQTIDTVLGVYNASGQRLASNDDANGTRWSDLTVGLQAGQRYHVAIGRYLGTTQPDGVSRTCKLTINGPNDDAHESQGGDTAATAVPLGTIRGQVVINGLTMLDRGDYFSFNLAEAARPNDFARLAFSHAAGDLDVQLLDSAGTVIQRSDGTSDSETLSLAGLAASTYRVRVYGYNGATNPSYSLTLLHELAPVTPAPTLGQRAIDWLLPQRGQPVGGGECSHMVENALAAVGAVPFWQLGPTGLDADYVWGTLVTEFRPGSDLSVLASVQPGDVIQYRDFTSPTATAGHHTSMVRSNDGNGRFTLLEQNWNGHRFVEQNTLDVSGMLTGVLRIYRPIAA